MTFQIIYPEQLENIIAKGNVTLVDIRSRKDYILGHYPKAVNWMLDEMADYEKLFKKNRFYVLYCEHGGSSTWYAKELGKKGYHIGTVVGGWESMKKKFILF